MFNVYGKVATDLLQINISMTFPVLVGFLWANVKSNSCMFFRMDDVAQYRKFHVIQWTTYKKFENQ